MLYTVVPLEFVLSQSFKEPPPVEALCIGNGVIETRRTPQGRQITRLFSTNLQDYLNPRYSVGQMID